MDENREQIHPLIAAFSQYLLAERNYAKGTANGYRQDLTAFCAWANIEPKKIGLETVRAYLAFCIEQGLSVATRSRRLGCFKHFAKFLFEMNICTEDPLARLKSIKRQRGLPKPISEEKISKLLAAPDDGLMGRRDKAVMEFLYGSGLRISECCDLVPEQIDVPGMQVRVTGKGNKTRLLSISKATVVALQAYLTVRGLPREGAPVFVGKRGEKLSINYFAWRIKRYGLAAGLTRQELTPHKLRHSCATHMHDHGADIRVIQEFLGHGSLATTQIYTQVSQKKQQAVYRLTHPRDSFEGAAASV